MVEIVDVRHVEDCFDGSLIKEVHLNETITKQLVYFLGEGGTVQYFAHFARPFFKVRQSELYDLKGIAGNNTMRVHLKQPNTYTIDHLNETIKKMCPDDNDAAVEN